MKGIIKSKLLVKHYKNLVAEKLRDHIISCRVNPTSMFHAPPKKINIVTLDINFISVGEWVEVDADRTPGFNSEGGRQGSLPRAGRPSCHGDERRQTQGGE
jgi:hypothetical protein